MHRQPEERRQTVEAFKLTKYDKNFDAQYRYDGGDLGCQCTEARAVFKLWSPEAERIELSLYRDDTSGAYETLPLIQGEWGVWSQAVEGDLHGVYYDYAVWTHGVRQTTADPYAIACGCNGVRSMAADLSRTNPEGWADDCPPPAGADHLRAARQGLLLRSGRRGARPLPGEVQGVFLAGWARQSPGVHGAPEKPGGDPCPAAAHL